MPHLSPAIIKLIAILWSPSLSTVARLSSPPTTLYPSLYSWTSIEQARRPSTTVEILSLSFTRSSSAFLTIDSPLAHAKAIDNTGSSSISHEILSSTVIAWSGAY